MCCLLFAVIFSRHSFQPVLFCLSFPHPFSVPLSLSFSVSHIAWSPLYQFLSPLYHLSSVTVPAVLILSSLANKQAFPCTATFQQIAPLSSYYSISNFFLQLRVDTNSPILNAPFSTPSFTSCISLVALSWSVAWGAYPR